jgi:hypothetical protein
MNMSVIVKHERRQNGVFACSLRYIPYSRVVTKNTHPDPQLRPARPSQGIIPRLFYAHRPQIVYMAMP